MDDSSDAKTTEAEWKALYITGGIAALAAVILFRRNWDAELMAFKGFGIFNVPETAPANALDWFTLLQSNKYIGLSLLGLHDLINFALVGLVFLALYGALKESRRGAPIVALSSGLVGIAVYFASNQAFNMLALSGRYAAATSDADRSLALASGDALLAQHNPGGLYQGTGIYIALFLVLVAGLIFSQKSTCNPISDSTTGLICCSSMEKSTASSSAYNWPRFTSPSLPPSIAVGHSECLLAKS